MAGDRENGAHRGPSVFAKNVHGVSRAVAASLVIAFFARTVEALPLDADSADAGIEELTERLLATPHQPVAALTLVFVFDGLRPDAIREQVTPNLYALRSQGVTFAQSHAVFPTVTRVNGAALATGSYPGRNGIVGNSLYIRSVAPHAVIGTSDWQSLRKLDAASGGRLLLTDSLGELLTRNGKKFAVLSTGSTGVSLLLNHRAPDGAGILVNGYLDPGKTVGFPTSISDAILTQFGAVPDGLAGIDWLQRVMRDYILPVQKPDVAINWLNYPDGPQHAHGVEATESTAVIRDGDRQVGLVLEQLRALGMGQRTNIIVVSDHGFGTLTQQVNLTQSLIDAGLKDSATSTDVVVVSEGLTSALHVAAHDPARITSVVQHLQALQTTDVIFTQARPGPDADADPFGFVPGTFSLQLIHQDSPERGADIIVTYGWSSDANSFGARGTDTGEAAAGAPTGPVSGELGTHGSMSPWNIKNTWFAWGPDFKKAVVSPVPAANVDLLPTVLTLAGVAPPAADGRVLAEAFEGGPDAEKVPVDTRTFLTGTERGYRAAIQISFVGRHRYVDKSWRIPP